MEEYCLQYNVLLGTCPMNGIRFSSYTVFVSLGISAVNGFRFLGDAVRYGFSFSRYRFVRCQHLGAQAKDKTTVGSSDATRYIAESISGDSEFIIHESSA